MTYIPGRVESADVQAELEAISRELELMRQTLPASYRASTQLTLTTSNQVIQLDTVDQDVDNAYSLASGEVTCREAGVYSVTFSIPTIQTGGGASRVGLIGMVQARPAGGNFSIVVHSYSVDYARLASGGQGVSGGCHVNFTEPGGSIRISARISQAQGQITHSSFDPSMQIHRVRM